MNSDLHNANWAAIFSVSVRLIENRLTGNIPSLHPWPSANLRELNIGTIPKWRRSARSTVHFAVSHFAVSYYLTITVTHNPDHNPIPNLTISLTLTLTLTITLSLNPNNNGVSTFTPRSIVSISRMLCLHAACSQPAIGHQPSHSAVWDRAMAGLLLFVDSFINRCYLLVSGSVRVRRGVTIASA